MGAVPGDVEAGGGVSEDASEGVETCWDNVQEKGEDHGLGCWYSFRAWHPEHSSHAQSPGSMSERDEVQGRSKTSVDVNWPVGQQWVHVHRERAVGYMSERKETCRLSKG